MLTSTLRMNGDPTGRTTRSLLDIVTGILLSLGKGARRAGLFVMLVHKGHFPRLPKKPTVRWWRSSDRLTVTFKAVVGHSRQGDGRDLPVVPGPHDETDFRLDAPVLRG